MALSGVLIGSGFSDAGHAEQQTYSNGEILSLVRHALQTPCREVLRMDEKTAGEIILIAGLIQEPKVKPEGQTKTQAFVNRQLALCERFSGQNFYDLVSFGETHK